MNFFDQSHLQTEEDRAIEQLQLESLSLQVILNQTKIRNVLSNALNCEQLIPADNGRSRDYRGLAELYGYSYTEIHKLTRSTDAMAQLLANVESRDRKRQFESSNNQQELHSLSNQTGSVATLLRHLRSIERFDAIDDLIAELKSLNLSAIADLKLPSVSNSIKPLAMVQFEDEKIDQNLTVDDLCIDSNQEQIVYDAYVSYADCDLPFVQNLCSFLESPQIGLRLFIRERDLLVGTMQFHAFTELMEKRCKRLLIVLSPEFLDSAECEFQTRFTMSLQIQERQRKLVPIVYRQCELPALIRFLSKIDLSRGDQIPQWTWRKLIFSLKPQTNENKFMPIGNNGLPMTANGFNNRTTNIVNQQANPHQMQTRALECVQNINSQLTTVPSVLANIRPNPTTAINNNNHNSVSGPLITELSSNFSSFPSMINNKTSNLNRSPVISRSFQESATASNRNNSANSTAILVEKCAKESSSSSSSPNPKPLLSRLWKKIGKTQLK